MPIDKAIAKWEPARRQILELNGCRISTLYTSGQIEAGIAAAEEFLKSQVGRVGEIFRCRLGAGTLAVGLMRAGRDADAIREFKAAIPILMAASRENADEDDNTAAAARSQRLQGIVEAYIAMLARNKNASADSVGKPLPCRCHSRPFGAAGAVGVERARVRQGSRAGRVGPQGAGSRQAGERSTRDAEQRIVFAVGRARRQGRPGHQRFDQRAARRSAQGATGNQQRFPAYADLVAPKPPSVEQIKATLTDGEAMLSFYFGQRSSFVWAVPKTVRYVCRDEGKQRRYREQGSQAPRGAGAAGGDDLGHSSVRSRARHELYSLLLQPVESGWKPAKNLVLVTNGALGLLPLSLLPTAPAEIGSDDDPLFAGYKKVPWLARTHAVTTVPSAAALRTLRQLPPGKPNRGELIAFGDPYFSKEQEAEAASGEKIRLTDASGNTTRGGPLKRRNSPKLDGVDSAELAMLPRLPDTSDELKSIALALQADPSKVLNLGKQANEQAVKTMDLSGFKVLAFATHGLVPGELNGLSQPALALSSPTVTGGDGDGLLTMEEILGLKLDADWVVLSACNTGTGAGAGAEAASGLGRAFFYAGTRALLVTNWSVHSQSARELVTDLFRRQAQDPKLTRGEALRQAMMALADGPGYSGADGKTEFAYAHPLFWAPYTIIGDGGVR